MPSASKPLILQGLFVSPLVIRNASPSHENAVAYAQSDSLWEDVRELGFLQMGVVVRLQINGRDAEHRSLTEDVNCIQAKERADAISPIRSSGAKCGLGTLTPPRMIDGR